MRFTKITHVSKEKYDGKVYDITVEDVHSYNIDNLIVHNSACGSLLLYLIGITRNIDPIKYNLLFERFLTVDRHGYPDCYKIA